FWYALAGDQGWWFALPGIVVVLLLSHWLIQPRLGNFSPLGLLRFSLYFLSRSVVGGLDVAWRALHPAMPLQLHYQEYSFHGPDGTARTLLIATLSLMPGTLSVNYRDDRLLIHSIAGNAEQAAEELERYCRGVFPDRSGAPS
ncbi:Na+/H+ antiporter subunit E, partial [Natronospira sp.]